MELYPSFETEASFRYLKKVVGMLNEPICILGGWAVYFTVQKEVENDKGVSYLGSRDIDLGFHIDKNAEITNLKQCSLMKTISILEKNGFYPYPYTFSKAISYDGKELSEEETSRMLPYEYFEIFVDLIVDEIHPNHKECFGFYPLDEPMLSYVFKDSANRVEMKEFNKLLWLPKPEILLATKIKCLPNRTKDHKITKDICDVYSLCWYSGINIKDMKERVQKYLTEDERKKFFDTLDSNQTYLKDSSRALGEDIETINDRINGVL